MEYTAPIEDTGETGTYTLITCVGDVAISGAPSPDTITPANHPASTPSQTDL